MIKYHTEIKMEFQQQLYDQDNLFTQIKVSTGKVKWRINFISNFYCTLKRDKSHVNMKDIQNQGTQ